MLNRNKNPEFNFSFLNCLKPRFLLLLALSSVARAAGYGNNGYSLYQDPNQNSGLPADNGVRNYHSFYQPPSVAQNGIFAVVGSHGGHLLNDKAKPSQEGIVSNSKCIQDGPTIRCK